jgi:threonine synthase
VQHGDARILALDDLQHAAEYRAAARAVVPGNCCSIAGKFASRCAWFQNRIVAPAMRMRSAFSGVSVICAASGDAPASTSAPSAASARAGRKRGRRVWLVVKGLVVKGVILMP